MARYQFLLALGTIVVLVGALYLGGNDYTDTILTQVAVAGCVVIGLNVLVGYTGVVSLGNVVFYGLSAYLTAAGTVQWHLNSVVAGLCGVAAAVALALVLGFPALRLRGGYLTLVTFAMAIAFYSVVEDSNIFNGETGIAGVPGLGAGSLAATSVGAKYLVSWLVCLAVATVGWLLKRRRFGRALQSVRGDETAAVSLGVPASRYKIEAFVVSAAFAGIGGVLMATTINYVNPDSFDLNATFNFFTMLFFGGIGTVWGGIAGAAVGVGIQQWFATLNAFVTLQPTIFALALIVILILRPSGLLTPLSRDEQQRTAASLTAVWRRIVRRGVSGDGGTREGPP